MNIAVAPHIPIIANGCNGNVEFDNLSLFDLPKGVTLYVPEKWYEFLCNCSGIAEDYELFSALLSLTVQEVSPVKKAEFVKLMPDILSHCNDVDSATAKQQLYAVSLCVDDKKIYAGISCEIEKFILLSDKNDTSIINFNPSTTVSLKEKFESYAPKLVQLKHSHERRKAGNREVSPFSAYDKHDEAYARQLLQQAYEDYSGDVTDNTFLYTYDAKCKTFVEFRPNRNGEYHGMDISRETARNKCPEIVKLYHQ